MKPNPLLLNRIVAELPKFAYRFANEAELHSGIAAVLDQAGIQYQHEFIAGPKDRFDFLIDTGIVIEAKIKGSLSPALIQCARYLKRDDVSVVVLVTTRTWGRVAPEYTTKDSRKPILTVALKGAAF